MWRMRIIPLIVLAAALVCCIVNETRTTFAGLPQTSTRPSDKPNPFVLVLIDRPTEEAIGPFPYDRSVYARAIHRANEAHARAVILKFFFDLPKSAEGDKALSDEMRRSKVLIEACIKPDEEHSNELPERFYFPDLADVADVPSGRTGWIPLAAFSQAASGVGFVDYNSLDHVPLVERYNGRTVKSLALCCLELAMDGTAKLAPGDRVRIGDRWAKLNDRAEIAVTFPKSDHVDYISFNDLLRGSVPAEALRDRVVIIGYDGETSPIADTPAGKMKIHRAFYLGLKAAYDQFQ
jgi:CHASE2 domain-containing sensor protein